MKAIGTDPTREKFLAALNAYDNYSNLLTGPITFKGSPNRMIGATKFVAARGQVEPQVPAGRRRSRPAWSTTSKQWRDQTRTKRAEQPRAADAVVRSARRASRPRRQRRLRHLRRLCRRFRRVARGARRRDRRADRPERRRQDDALRVHLGFQPYSSGRIIYQRRRPVAQSRPSGARGSASAARCRTSGCSRTSRSSTTSGSRCTGT